jgi:phosphatidate phosphatase APP1
MELHRNMGFILIGDSGEHDPDVYLRAVKENTPGRVLAVYIRSVNPERAEHVERMAEEAAKYGTDWLLVKDTVAAAEHAASRGWILPTALDEIRADRAEDRQAPTPVEALLKETNPDAEG